MSYKLRCSLHGHASDVRAVAASQNCIVSGSRDMTSKLWTPNSLDQCYKEEKSFRGHTNFVNAVCVVAPNEQFPKGLILTASSDKSIGAFDFENESPLYRLTGHNNVVCSLAIGKFGTIVSGSWDNTAKVWLNQKCVMTLEGHSGSVWAVELMSRNGLVVTGSADKTVKVWRAGECDRTLIGHTDCVRGLAVLSEDRFLSSANDGTIRQWLITGECEAVYEGHESFVYCIAILPYGSGFVTGSEDRSVRVWKDGKCSQVLRLPAQSVWSVAALSNGDVVTGTSDGTVRIFTSDPERRASPEEIKAFDEEVANSTISTGEIGNLKINELPGKESLYEPGKRDGQTKLVREDGKVGVYQWNAEDYQWFKIGDAVGSTESSTSSSKVQYGDKEYDYVFDVDIEEGKPPLKLPYNVTEDPWFAAQKFLDNNNISQLYLDQVANFIVKNTKGLTLGSSSSSTYEDPFTGASRYKPGGTAPASVGSSVSSDPFTGGGRYIPKGGQDVPAAAEIGSKYFPLKSVLSFEASANKNAIKAKLLEFNELQLKDVVLPETAIDNVLQLVDVNTQCTDMQLGALDRMLQWPNHHVFPVLDVLRLAIRNSFVNQRCCSESNGQIFFNMLDSHVHRYSSESPANCNLSLKVLCNMTCHEAGRNLFLLQRAHLISHIMDIMPCDNKNVQIASATILLNCTVLLANCKDDEAASAIISAIAFLLQTDLDNEAKFRLLVALGTQMLNNSESIAIARSFELTGTISKLVAINNPNKLSECARDVLKILQA
ncbi:hypothetical protein CHUAL_004620 [Chamberlinius hualienensis]